MSDEQKKGSGLTYRTILLRLRRQLEIEYDRELEAMQTRKMLTKKQRSDLLAGFQDGATMLTRHLVGMGAIVIEDDSEKDGEAQ